MSIEDKIKSCAHPVLKKAFEMQADGFLGDFTAYVCIKHVVDGKINGCGSVQRPIAEGGLIEVAEYDKMDTKRYGEIYVHPTMLHKELF